MSDPEVPMPLRGEVRARLPVRLAILMALKPGQPFDVPSEILLSGCPVGPIDIARPDANRVPLPPGQYQLIAILGDGTGASLVSRPATITVKGS